MHKTKILYCYILAANVLLHIACAGNYMNPEIVEYISYPRYPLSVKCFFNGLWWACPDPKDLKLVDEITRNYEEGSWITYDTYYISEGQYRNCNNWNSPPPELKCF